jgi:hypothetical protein
MDLEVSAEKNQNSNLLAIKVNFLTKIQYRNYKSEVEIVRKRFLKMQENYINKKSADALLINGLEDPNSSKAQRQKLIENEEMAWEQHQNLEQGKRKAIETEKVSFDIMLNLDRQTNQMKGIRDNMFVLNQNVDKSESIITRMMRRENRNKIYILIFSSIFILLFCVFLYFKLFY